MRLVKMCLTFKIALLFGVYAVALSAGQDVFVDPVGNQCTSSNLGGVDYILRVRGEDYGWKVLTHRANIALAVEAFNGTLKDVTKMDLMKMELQLEEEVIKALLRNQTSPMNENDLAMFIHALIATRRNPWDFHGLDLVGDLLYRVKDQVNVHPFLVLALCNSHAVEKIHLERIKTHLEKIRSENTEKERNPEDVAKQAIALKAFSCAASLPYAESLDLEQFTRAMNTAKDSLVSIQHPSEGKFGNVYTTSLVVQALTAYDASGWAEERALDYLQNQSQINVNLLQAYYIVMALNARKVSCIKDLYGGYIGRPEPAEPLRSTTYSIMDEQNPDVYFSVYMKVPKSWNFFQVMEKARDTSRNFDFSYVLDKHNKPSVYEAIGKPNDAEQNLFWTICLRFNINHDPHSSQTETQTSSPVDIQVPDENHHFILYYRSSRCQS